MPGMVFSIRKVKCKKLHHKNIFELIFHKIMLDVKRGIFVFKYVVLLVNITRFA